MRTVLFPFMENDIAYRSILFFIYFFHITVSAVDQTY